MMNSQRTLLHQQYTVFPKVHCIKEIFEDPQDGRQCAFILRIERGAAVRIDTVMDPDGQFKLQEPSVSAKACRKPGETLLGVVNADFFNMSNGVPHGPVVMSGRILKEEMGDGTFFFGIQHDGTPVIGTCAEFPGCKQSLQMAVGSRHLLVDGNDFPEPMLEPKLGRHPRTGVAICENGDLLLVVTDGRAPGEADGLHLNRFARYLKSLGAEKALNLDGGGSSVMALRMPGRHDIEILNTPSDGYERVCANGIGLFAQKPGDGVCLSACITPQQEYAAPGTHLKLTASGLDDLLSPCPLPADAYFSVPEDSGCSVSPGGDFIASETDCDVTVSLSAGDRLLGTALLHIRTPDALHLPDGCILTDGEVHTLPVSATLNNRSVLTNCTSYHFRPLCDIGSFDESGRFHAKHARCEGDVLVRTKNNGPSAVFHVRVGRLPQLIEIAPKDIEASGCTVTMHRPLTFSSRCGQQVYLLHCLRDECTLQFDAPVHKQPSAIGLWAHAAEGALPAFSLADQSAAFTKGEPSDPVWTYLQAPVPADSVQADTRKVRITLTGAQGKHLAIDSFRWIYDYVSDDLLLPEIRQISVKKHAASGESERIKITAYFGLGDLAPCFVPIDYKRLRILIDGDEYTGVPGHYGVNKGGASLLLHNVCVSKGRHCVRACAQTLGGKQVWEELIFDTDHLETI